jgi:hypothetical protein
MFDRLIRNVSNLLFPSRSNSATLPLDQPEQFGERKLFDSCPGDCSGVFHREETESQKRNIIGPGVFAVSPSLSLSLSLSLRGNIAISISGRVRETQGTIYVVVHGAL